MVCQLYIKGTLDFRFDQIMRGQNQVNNKCDCGARTNKACTHHCCAKCCVRTMNHCKVHNKSSWNAKRALQIHQAINKYLSYTVVQLKRQRKPLLENSVRPLACSTKCDDLKEDDMKTILECGICRERVKRVVYSCGHALCYECFQEQSKGGKCVCHICRRESVQAINLFL